MGADQSGLIAGRSNSDEEEGEVGHRPQNLRPVELFFSTKWLDALYRVTVRVQYGVLMCTIVWLVVCIVFASQLEPLSRQEEWFPESHWIGKGLKWLDEEFSLTDQDQRVIVYVTWGVEGINRNGTDPYDPSQRGTPIFHKSFDVSSPAAQQHIVDVCQSASTLNVYRKIRSCVMQSYADWLTATNQSFPYTSPDPQNRTAAFNHSSTQSQARALTAATCFDRPPPARLNPCKLSLSRHWNRASRMMWSTSCGATRVRCLVGWGRVSQRQGGTRRVRRSQTTDSVWTWMMTERALVTNVIQGMGESIVVALIVLVLCTMNVLVGVAATGCIVGIASSVLAVMQWAGWQLGITESVAAVIWYVRGLLYVVHIAVAYVEARDSTRLERSRTALAEIAISIMTGAITTLGAGLFLFGAVVTFFTKFGILIVSTIASSFVWALIVFVTVLATFGPEAEAGSLKPMITRARGRMCGGRTKQPADAAQKQAAADSTTQHIQQQHASKQGQGQGLGQGGVEMTYSTSV